MNAHLQERFAQLLAFAKDPKFQRTARENIAAARELVDTLLSCGLIGPQSYRAYQAQVTTAQLVVSAAELKRSTDTRKGCKCDVHDCANGRMHDAPKGITTTMPGGYLA